MLNPAEPTEMTLKMQKHVNNKEHVMRNICSERFPMDIALMTSVVGQKFSHLRMPDGLHPNAKGHLKLATCLVNTSLNHTFGEK